MKQILTIAFVTVCVLNGFTQEFKVKGTSGTLYIKNVDDVTIEGYNGSEIIFTSHDFDQSQSERSKGLRLLGSMGVEDNTSIGLSVKQEGNEIHVTKVKKHDDSEYTIKVPKGYALDVSSRSQGGDDVKIMNIDKEVTVSLTYGDLIMQDITGPVSAKTLYGDIDLSFTKVAPNSNNTIHASYGHIDMTIPESTKASFSISNSYGETFTDLKFESILDTSCEGCQKTINLNGGGETTFTLKSNYEDIYLRKRK